ncbi:putative tetratricopeptide-like helical domain superfamily [Helianthus annuus]|uniref:Putative tetratricopeptide-like helical domain-containing protein n=1 Tax=Helianthus annuus TaxID=4232 RepID=A0A251VJ81_HELAN|nr:pentatricopeptide repeat-containing protein At5g15010, mitochondrial [Helianthus annuus]KAF5819623.1 putative tetratricopeptide-like helical domain superfamily [Helianthus annuus]KAJ0619782.1 putative tetratricopeptide-like helical domain superfamily [Helianthus annuus]
MYKYKNIHRSLSLLSRTYETIVPFQHVNPSKPMFNHPIKPVNSPLFFCSSTLGPYEHDEIEFRNCTETLGLVKDSVEKIELERGVGLIMNIIGPPGRDYAAVRNNLEQCNASVSPELVTEILSRVRNDWKAAFTFFRWAGKQPGYTHSLRQYHCVIAILGKMRRFNAAWALVNEMNKSEKSMVSQQTLLIMIRKYSAVHDVDKAVKTFNAFNRFNLQAGVHEFHDLLIALCRCKNVKEAEGLMKGNKDVYPLTTKSFNIILNGWCNVVCSPREGRRIWWEMCNERIPRDVISYSTIITCYSKCNETKEVIKIFNELKASGVNPDIRIYNGVIHAFSKSGLEKDARELMNEMKENGIRPNAITYNSMIMPFCKKGKTSDAYKLFDEMLQRKLVPTVQTYQAFFRASRTSKEALSILQKMNEMGCCMDHDTYALLIRKLCRWGRFEEVWKLWNEMISSGLDHDRSSYVALVNGLFLNGKLEEAYKYQVEMKSKGLLPEPVIEETLQAWMAAKQTTERSMVDSKTKCSDA